MLDPSKINVYVNKGDVLEKLGDHEKSAIYYNIAKELKEISEASK